MRRHLRSLTLKSAIFIGLLAAAACSVDAPTSVVGPSASANRGWQNRGFLPGSKRSWGSGTSALVPLNCVPKHPAYGSAIIGAKGGDLIVGPHRLIIPPGALTHDVEISGTVPADKPFEINLQPHGLQFKKAAGLILDASDCTHVPTIVYLIDQFTVSDPIVAIYSNWWHTIACPIWHFSGYSMAWDQGTDDGRGTE